MSTNLCLQHVVDCFYNHQNFWQEPGTWSWKKVWTTYFSHDLVQSSVQQIIRPGVWVSDVLAACVFTPALSHSAQLSSNSHWAHSLVSFSKRKKKTEGSLMKLLDMFLRYSLLEMCCWVFFLCVSGSNFTISHIYESSSLLLVSTKMLLSACSCFELWLFKTFSRTCIEEKFRVLIKRHCKSYRGIWHFWNIYTL